MTKSTHGGSRPATRPDDGRHNNKHGSPGRLPKKFALKVGDRLYIDGGTETWLVSEIDRTQIQLSTINGDTMYIAYANV